MGTQRLGAKKRRKLEAQFGETFAMVTSSGDQSWVSVVTFGPNHRHGAVDRRNGVLEWADPEDYVVRYTAEGRYLGTRGCHFTSCEMIERGERPEGA